MKMVKFADLHAKIGSKTTKLPLNLYFVKSTWVLKFVQNTLIFLVFSYQFPLRYGTILRSRWVYFPTCWDCKKKKERSTPLVGFVLS